MHTPAPKQLAQASKDTESGLEGHSMAAPAFQLKASSLMDLVSPVAALATSSPPVQMASINDFNDKDPQHDPSLVSDAQIQATDEYIKLLQTHHLVPTTDPSVLYTPEEILMACRLMLRAMRQGVKLDPIADSVAYLDKAREQTQVSEQAQGMENELHWKGQWGDLTANPFGKWLLENGSEPTSPGGGMNCWEFVMFSAYRLGYTSKGKLTALYKEFGSTMNNNGDDHVAAFGDMETKLQGSKPQAYLSGEADSAHPLNGDMVIFGGMYGHVAIATGNMISKGKKEHAEIMSLWSQNNGRVYRTTIEELNAANGPVRFFSPKW